MALEFPTIRRQRKPGAFPTADALRAAKAAALAVSVTPDLTLPPAAPVEKLKSNHVPPRSQTESE